MKTFQLKNIALFIVLLTACKQEPIVPQEQTVTPDTSCQDATKGSADFTKFVAVGSSYTAGFQAGALFTDGQNNSLPAILNKQFQCVGASATFNQPTIGSALGYNIFVSPNPDANNHIFGRFLLEYNGASSPTPTPQLSTIAALPNPAANPSFIFGDGSEKASLNNFGIQAIVLGQALIPQTGDWSGAGTDPRFNPFYGRLAYPGTGSTLIGDAAAAGGTFFMLWLGMDDFMLYAVYGGDAKLAPLTSSSDFAGEYGAAVGAMLSPPNSPKGVLGNFPDIFAMPHFTSVGYNPIPLDASTAAAVNTGFAGYNAALGALIANASAFGVSSQLAAELNTRMVSFAAVSNNRILIMDETLTNLGPYFDELEGAGAITANQRAQLTPYQQVRQTTSSDIIPLATGSILGTLVNNDPTLVNGVSVPLADRYAITPSERDSINAARNSFNATVSGAVLANPTRLALGDVNTFMGTINANQAAIRNNITVTPNINPPTGMYSEDGLHPNSRGYAFISIAFINGINDAFGATVPPTDISLYSATALPIP
jgi:lysophospholipase L1-like esterase